MGRRRRFLHAMMDDSPSSSSDGVSPFCSCPHSAPSSVLLRRQLLQYQTFLARLLHFISHYKIIPMDGLTDRRLWFDDSRMLSGWMGG